MSTRASDQFHPLLRHHLVNTLGWRDLRPLQEPSEMLEWLAVHLRGFGVEAHTSHSSLRAGQFPVSPMVVTVLPQAHFSAAAVGKRKWRWML